MISSKPAMDERSPLLLENGHSPPSGALPSPPGSSHDRVSNGYGAQEPQATGGQRRFFCLRHLFALLGCLGFANVYAMRVNLSVAIVAMVNHTAVDPPVPHDMDGTHNDQVCPVPINPDGNHTIPNEDGPFDWDANSQGYILGAFFYGYICTQVLGGVLAENYGGKWVYGLGVLVTTIFTLLTPLAAKTSFGMLIATRVIEGLGEGVTFPVMHAMVSAWSPPMERSRMSAFIYAGAQLGTVISLPISGLLCDSYGWESVFYVFGTLGIVWFCAWALLVADSPGKILRRVYLLGSICNNVIPITGKHRWISEEERVYIEGTLGQSRRGRKAPSIPWRKIFRSKPVWAIIVGHCAQNWGFYTMLNELPTYMKEVLHFNIKENAFLSALPYLIMWMCSVLGSILADYLRSPGRLSTTLTRKIFNTIAFIGPAITLVLLIFAGCDHTTVITLLCLTVGLNGFNYSGVNCNHIDIAPNFAGTLMGLSNTAANVMGFVTPMVISHIVEATEDLHHWHIVFIIAAVVYSVGDTIYVTFASGEEQDFNAIQSEDNTEADGEV